MVGGGGGVKDWTGNERGNCAWIGCGAAHNGCSPSGRQAVMGLRQPKKLLLSEVTDSKRAGNGLKGQFAEKKIINKNFKKDQVTLRLTVELQTETGGGGC